MGMRNKYPGHFMGVGRVVAHGRVRLGDAVPTAPAVVAGTGFTVARSAAGKYTITFLDKTVEFECVVLSMTHTDGTACQVVNKGLSVANKTIDFWTYVDAAGAAALGEDATKCFVDFIAICRDSSRDL